MFSKFAKSKLRFGVYRGGKRIKQLKGDTHDDIYVRFNDFCKSQGCIEDFQTPASYGYLGWRNPHNGTVLTLRKE